MIEDSPLVELREDQRGEDQDSEAQAGHSGVTRPPTRTDQLVLVSRRVRAESGECRR